MKKYFLIAAAAGLVIAGLYLFRPEADYDKPTAGQNIIFFGDSLVSGVGAEGGKDIVTHLSEITGQNIINAGQSGDTTVSALGRIEADVLSQNPRVVIVMLGGNDFLQRIPAEQTAISIRTITEKILQTGSGVILVNENRNLGSSDYFENLAKEKRIPYIENILGGIVSDKKLMSDPIHPNSEGYAIMAQAIKPVLEQYLNP